MRAMLSLLAIAFAFPSSANASVRECGDVGKVQSGQKVVYNVTTRDVGCAFARRFARARERVRFRTRCDGNAHHVTPDGKHRPKSGRCRFRGYMCTTRPVPSDVDRRSVRGKKVIRWQTYFPFD